MQTNQAAKHTPGPWFIGTGATIVGLRPDNSGLPLMVAQCVRPIHGDERTDWAYMNANARLIAQAPALLAALREMLQMHEERFGAPGMSNVAYMDARATIARAEGR